MPPERLTEEKGLSRTQESVSSIWQFIYSHKKNVGWFKGRGKEEIDWWVC